MGDHRPRRACVQKQVQERTKELYRAEHAMCTEDLTSFATIEMFKDDHYNNAINIEFLGDIGNYERTPSKQRITSALSSVGKDMYSFGCTQSPSVKVASVSRTGSTRSRRSTVPGIPTSRTPSRRVGENVNMGTPTRRISARTPRSQSEPTTPHATRRKIAACLGKSKEETLNNREDSEDSEDDDDEETSEEEIRLEDEDEERSDYFSQNVRQRRGVKATSDHTMSKLGAAMLSEEQISTILKNQRDVHAKHRNRILETLCKNFPFWLQLMLERSNLLLYGLGSKTNIMSKLADFLVEEGYITMVINGYLPTCGLQEIVNSILECVIEDRPKGVFGLQAQVDFICKYFTRKESLHFFLLVNSIDAPALTNPKILQIFEKLASVSQIHFVGTVNHINAPLLYDLNRASAM
ncbi:origin recognition complex subunit 2-like, partial [Tropilaelaps mercedesae]